MLQKLTFEGGGYTAGGIPAPVGYMDVTYEDLNIKLTPVPDAAALHTAPHAS